MREARETGLVGPALLAPAALALVLMLLFIVRLVQGVHLAFRYGRPELVRLDLAFLLLLAVPAAPLVGRVRSRLAPPSDPPLRAWALLLTLTALAIVLGHSPGLFVTSLLELALQFTVFTTLGSVVVHLAGSRRGAGPFAAWLLASSFLLSAAWHVAVPSLVAHVLIRP